MKYIDKALELFIGEGNDYQFQDQSGIWRRHNAVEIKTTRRGILRRQPLNRFLQKLLFLPLPNIEVDSVDVYIPIEYKENGLATIKIVTYVNQPVNSNLCFYEKGNVTMYWKPLKVEMLNGTEVHHVIKFGDVSCTW